MNPLDDKASSVQRGRRGLTQGARELCEHFIGCSCSRLHHPKQAPYVWQYRVNPGGWKLLLSTEMELVEKAFCNNEDETEATIKISVPFEDILHPTPTDSDNGISLRRMSTRSYAEAGSDDISLYTQWVWYWQDNNGEWSPFMKPELQLTLETKYLAGQDTYLYTIGDQEYRLDFTSLVQVNRKYQTWSPVHRRPVFVSIDDARQRQQTCSSLLMSPAAVRAYRVPFNWTPLDRYQDSEMVDLAPSSDEYCTVMSSICKTLSLHKKFEVRHIYRLQNALLWYTYDCMKKTLQMSHDKVNIDERQLFHGTDTIDVVNDICINNFDFRVSGKNATVYGKGAYFARDAHYSHLYTKGRRRYLFLARVLVGKYTLGDSTYTRPPRRKGHVRYDSCVDDKKNPSIFVIFERNQCYPEYLVEYKEISVEAESTLTQRSIRSATMSPPAVSTSKTTNVRHLRPSTPPVVKTQAGYLTMDYSWTPSKTLPTSIPTSSGFSRNVRHLRPSTEAVVKTEAESLTLNGTSSKTTPTSIQPSSLRPRFVHDLSPSTEDVVKTKAESLTLDGTSSKTTPASIQPSSVRPRFVHDLSPSTEAVVKTKAESLTLDGTSSKATPISIQSSSVRSRFVHDLSPSTTSFVKADSESVTQDLYGTPPETNLTSFQSSSARLSFVHDRSPSTEAVVKTEAESLTLDGTSSKATPTSIQSSSVRSRFVHDRSPSTEAVVKTKAESLTLDGTSSKATPTSIQSSSVRSRFVHDRSPSTEAVVKTKAESLTLDGTSSKATPTSIQSSSVRSRFVHDRSPSTEAVVKTEAESLMQDLDWEPSKTYLTSFQSSSARLSFVHDRSPSTEAVVKADSESVTQDLYGTPQETNLTSFQSSSARLSFAHDLSPSTAAVVKAESESLMQNLGGTPSKPTTSSLEYIRYFHPGIRAARDYIMGICCLTKNIILIIILMHTLIDIK